MASFQVIVTEALRCVEESVAEQCRRIQLEAGELEARLLREASEVAEQRRNLEERARQLEREHQLRQEELELRFQERAAAVEYDRTRLEEERAQLAQGTGPGNVISLSLGGEKTVDVKRATLCQCEDSLFGAMFSGRWDAQLDRDQAGRVHLDFNAALLMPLIDHLRARRCCPGSSLPGPRPPPGMELEFKSMLSYYGMEHFVLERQAETVDEDSGSWAWDQLKSSSPGGQMRVFSQDRREVEASGSSPIFGNVEFATGCHVWAVKLLSGNFACVGVGTSATRRGMGQPYGSTALVYDCYQGHVNGAYGVPGLVKAHREDTIGVRLDVGSKTISFFRNGSHMADAPLTALAAGPYVPIMGLWGGVGAPSRARLISTSSLQ